jgi:hypothetical protein
VAEPKTKVSAMTGVLLLLFALGCEGSSQVVPGKLSVLATVPPNKAWLACSKNSQCSATSLSCHGWIAINRLHETDVQKWYSHENADILSVVECTGPSQPQPATVCHVGVCQLK